MSPSQALNPLRMPLTGRHLIEASAGTGKTWTLSALYVRLVLGLRQGQWRSETPTAADVLNASHANHADHPEPPAAGPFFALEPPLMPPQILVMTFTDAATSELKDRIRQRLNQSVQAFAQDAAPGDAFLQQLRASIHPAQWPQCLVRLQSALQWMDEAAIHTLHGWSLRMLREHAFDSQSLFDQTRVEDVQALQRQVVQDLWRQWFYPLSQPMAQWVSRHIATDPQGWRLRLATDWQALERSPESLFQALNTPATASDAAALLQACSDGLNQAAALEQRARDLWDTAAEAQVLQAAQTQLNRRIYNKKNLPHWLQQMQAWQQGAALRAELVQRFGRSTLTEKGWLDVPAGGVFDLLDELVELHQQLALSGRKVHALAVCASQQALHTSKLQRGQFDFSDLLVRLHHALLAEDGRMAAAVRAQYPVAMVDEFQDTDAWQYGSLQRLYMGQPDATLVVIGDPKQAIYRFRGADLATYLRARRDILAENPNGLHTLTHNHRSNPDLVQAVNHVFGQTDNAFGNITFAPVQAAKSHTDVPLLPNSQGVAIQVLHLLPDGPKALGKALYQDRLAQACAERIAQLLSQGVVQAGEVAVLVRNHLEHQSIQRHLRARRVPSVFLSERSSVFQTPEAMDLWHWLHALSEPRHTARLRAALSTRLWGLPTDTLQQLLEDAERMDVWQEQALQWHQRWLSAGVLPMLHQWLHHTEPNGSSLAQRLLTDEDGERRISNLLHLGELLQHAAQTLQGSAALVRHLGTQIHTAHASQESAQMRLESDAQRVQVVTIHKSKGLEYPVVLVPFLSGFAKPKAAASTTSEAAEPTEPSDISDADQSTDSSDAEDGSDEDMRLVYVALTRAQRSLWLGVASLAHDLKIDAKETSLSALSVLLQRQSKHDLAAQLQALWQPCPQIAITQLQADQPSPLTRLPPHDAADSQAQARLPRALSGPRWWSASFSAITRQLDDSMAQSASDEQAPELASWAPDHRVDAEIHPAASASAEWQAFPAGTRAGLFLHELLEWQCREGWPLAQSPPTTHPEWANWVGIKARQWGIPAEAQEGLDRWLRAITTTPVPLPEVALPDMALPQAAQPHVDQPSQANGWVLAGAATTADWVLGQLAADQCWAEMPFTLSVQPSATQQIDQLIQRHVLPGQARPALRAQMLNGMLTGVMDVVAQHAGRYWVLDHKSNRLAGYTSAQLDAAVLHHRYDVQYVLYTLALHRLLTSRWPGYRYAQHMGGAVYLFLRGVHTPGAGAHVARVPEALIVRLDALFRGKALA